MAMQVNTPHGDRDGNQVHNTTWKSNPTSRSSPCNQKCRLQTEWRFPH